MCGRVLLVRYRTGWWGYLAGHVDAGDLWNLQNMYVIGRCFYSLRYAIYHEMRWLIKRMLGGDVWLAVVVWWWWWWECKEDEIGMEANGLLMGPCCKDFARRFRTDFANRYLCSVSFV